MSKSNMKKFLLRLEQDEEVKSKFNKIMAFSDSKIGILDKSDHMVENEVISLASTVGITLAMDDLIKNPIEQALADDQLNEVVGGRGEFTFRFDRYICDFCPNNETFLMHYSPYRNECPSFEGPRIAHACTYCRHLQRVLLI